MPTIPSYWKRYKAFYSLNHNYDRVDVGVTEIGKVEVVYLTGVPNNMWNVSEWVVRQRLEYIEADLLKAIEEAEAWLKH